MKALQVTTDERLLAHCQQIADAVSNGIEVTQDEIDGGYFDYEYEAGEVLTALDYLQDALDIRYLVNSDNELLQVQILVAFGGPNIWVDIWADGDGEVRGYWASDSARIPFKGDAMGIFETLKDLRAC